MEDIRYDNLILSFDSTKNSHRISKHFLTNIRGQCIDDENKNSFAFPSDTTVAAQNVLHIYCCSKGRDYSKAKKPYIYWTNKDGSPRMKNVLNDDGDKIILWDNHNVLVSTCEKIHPDKALHGHKGKLASSDHIVINTGPAHGDTVTAAPVRSIGKSTSKKAATASTSLSFSDTGVALSASQSTFKQSSPRMSTSSSFVPIGNRAHGSRSFAADNSSHIPFNSPTRYAIGSNSSVIESCFMNKPRQKPLLAVATPVTREKKEEGKENQSFFAFLLVLFADMYARLLQILTFFGVVPVKKDRIGMILLLLLLFLLYDRLLHFFTPRFRVVPVDPLTALRKKINILENDLNGAMKSFKSTKQMWADVGENRNVTYQKVKMMELRATLNSLVEDADEQKEYFQSLHDGESTEDKMNFDRLFHQVKDFNKHHDSAASGLDGILSSVKKNIQEEESLRSWLPRGPNSNVLHERERQRNTIVKETIENYIEETKEAKCGDCDANKLVSRTNYAALYRGASVVKSYSYGHEVGHILPITSPMLNPLEWYRHASGFQGYETTDSNIVLSTSFPDALGQCFAFAGNDGYITIDLSESIIPLSIQMYHFVPPVEFHTYNFSKQIAPKEFSVYAWTHLVDEDKPIHLGDFEYITYATHEDHSSKLLQNFELKHSKLTNKQRHSGIKKITVYIKNNGGDEVLTCLYRLKIFGSLSANATPSSTDK